MRRPSHASAKSSRGASILLAVLIAIVLATLAGVTLAAVADAQLGGTAVSLERDRLRSLAWSGVRVAMARIESQRGELLGAGRPDLPELLLELETGGERLEAKLLPLDSVGTLALPENAKIDANRAPKEVLAKLAALGEAGADRIIAARGSAANLDDLGAKAGFSHAELHGSAKSGAGLAGLLTVFSFDPATQSGGGDGHTGLARIPFPRAMSDKARESLKQRLGDLAAAAVDTLSRDDKPPASRSELFNSLIRAGVPLDSIDAALDLFTFSPDPFAAGLVNINEAPAEVLRCLPGLDAAAAESIVNARATIDTRGRAKISWILAQSAVNQDQYHAVLDWVTTRSLQWRVRVEAAIRPRDAARTSAATAQTAPAPTGRRLVLEVVIDAAGTRTRIASMKDVTYLDLALAAVAAAAKDEPSEVAAEDQPRARPDKSARQDSDESEPPPDEPMVEPPAEPAAPPEEPPQVGPPAPARDPRVGRWRAGG